MKPAAHRRFALLLPQGNVPRPTRHTCVRWSIGVVMDVLPTGRRSTRSMTGDGGEIALDMV